MEFTTKDKSNQESFSKDKICVKLAKGDAVEEVKTILVSKSTKTLGIYVNPKGERNT